MRLSLEKPFSLNSLQLKPKKKLLNLYLETLFREKQVLLFLQAIKMVKKKDHQFSEK